MVATVIEEKICQILVILCGLPSSGKSTFARGLKEALNHLSSNFRRGVEIIDIDIIRDNLFGSEFFPENERYVRKKAVNICETKIKNKKSVIIDDINYYSSMRHEFVSIAMKFQIPYFLIYINTPKAVCKEWNIKRGTPISKELIDNIYKKFEIPGKKYAWDRPYLTFNLSEIKLEKAISEFIEKIKNFKMDSNKAYDQNISNHVGNLNYGSQRLKYKYSDFEKIEYITRRFVSLYSKILLRINLSNIDSLNIELEFPKLNESYQFNEKDLKELSIILQKIKSDLKLLNLLRRSFIKKLKSENYKFSTINKLLNRFFQYLKN
ncbi:MAG: AAA family ATPase [Promethearchaeota archaeon]